MRQLKINSSNPEKTYVIKDFPNSQTLYIQPLVTKLEELGIRKIKEEKNEENFRQTNIYVEIPNEDACTRLTAYLEGKYQIEKTA